MIDAMYAPTSEQPTRPSNELPPPSKKSAMPMLAPPTQRSALPSYAEETEDAACCWEASVESHVRTARLSESMLRLSDAQPSRSASESKMLTRSMEQQVVKSRKGLEVASAEYEQRHGKRPPAVVQVLDLPQERTYDANDSTCVVESSYVDVPLRFELEREFGTWKEEDTTKFVSFIKEAFEVEIHVQKVTKGSVILEAVAPMLPQAVIDILRAGIARAWTCRRRCPQ